LIAVVSNAPLRLDVPVFGLDDVGAITDFIIAHVNTDSDTRP
jgi:hypothetical protein